MKLFMTLVILLFSIKSYALLPFEEKVKNSYDRPKCPKGAERFFKRLSQENGLFGCIDKKSKAFVGNAQFIKISQSKNGTIAKEYATIAVKSEEQLKICEEALEQANVTLASFATNSSDISRDAVKNLYKTINSAQKKYKARVIQK